MRRRSRRIFIASFWLAFLLLCGGPGDQGICGCSDDPAENICRYVAPASRIVATALGSWRSIPDTDNYTIHAQGDLEANHGVASDNE